MSRPPAGAPHDDDAGTARARRRRRGLLNHLIAYFAVLVFITPINAWADPHRPWFLLPAVGWGAPLAVHVAWVMGLFDRRRGNGQ